MDAVGAVNVSISGRPKHHRVAFGPSAVTVRGRIGVMVGLDFDDHAPGAVEEEARSDQFRGNIVDAASEKRLMESFLCAWGNSRRSCLQSIPSHAVERDVLDPSQKMHCGN
jgi:hypothetical protein